ncbi:MAG: tetratricopeptide repeat protein [Moorea sp. SIO3I7]|nr:tetratricopeptide repeat protein [Moorena sp. SIO3I7]
MNQNLCVKPAAILGTVVGVMGMGVAFPRYSWGQSIIAQQLSSPGSERAEELSLAEASQLTQQAIKLYQQGKYSEAIPLAERALEIRQEILGEEHPDVAISLNNLAGFYESQGRYVDILTVLEER